MLIYFPCYFHLPLYEQDHSMAPVCSSYMDAKLCSLILAFSGARPSEVQAFLVCIFIVRLALKHRQKFLVCSKGWLWFLCSVLLLFSDGSSALGSI